MATDCQRKYFSAMNEAQCLTSPTFPSMPVTPQIDLFFRFLIYQNSGKIRCSINSKTINPITRIIITLFIKVPLQVFRYARLRRLSLYIYGFPACIYAENTMSSVPSPIFQLLIICSLFPFFVIFMDSKPSLLRICLTSSGEIAPDIHPV